MLILIIIVLLVVVAYFYFTRSGDSKVAGKINPQALEMRRSMLRTTDERVHEQFAMLFAAATVTAELSHPQNFARVNQMTSEGQEGWIRLQLAESLTIQGFHPSMLRAKLARYVFELYRPYFVTRKNSDGLDLKEAGELGVEICREGAAYLDDQFEREGRADVCAFLKNEGPKESFRATDTKPKSSNHDREVLLGGIESTAEAIMREEGRSQHDAQFLAIVAFLDDLQNRPNGQAGSRLVVDIARNEYSQHFNEVLMYIGWRDGKLFLKPDVEARLKERLQRNKAV